MLAKDFNYDRYHKVFDPMQENLRKFEGASVPLGSVDISLYRDDLTELSDLPEIGESQIPFEVM